MVSTNIAESIMRTIKLSSIATVLCIIAAIGSSAAAQAPPALRTANASRAEEPAPNRSFVLKRLYDDASYLAGDPGFYVVAGGLLGGARIFKTQFDRESPKFTELWGPSPMADNFFEFGEQYGNGIFPFTAAISSWGIGRLIGSDQLCVSAPTSLPLRRSAVSLPSE